MAGPENVNATLFYVCERVNIILISFKIRSILKFFIHRTNSSETIGGMQIEFQYIGTYALPLEKAPNLVGKSLIVREHPYMS